MLPLPIDAILPAVSAALRDGPAAVVVAAPGAGKTTRVPPAVLDAAGVLRRDQAVLVLQPRRIAARATAARIAEERGSPLGREVGYHVRFERRAGRETRLLVMTEGILTRRLLDDPFLDGVGAVVLDEFHERSLHTDLAVALLREVQETVRPDLKLVVMSATLDAEPIARFLGGAPILRADSRPHPVAIDYRPAPASTPLGDRVRDAVREALDDPGDILVFLPGSEEIRRSATALAGAARDHDLLVLPLHGSLPADEQDRALRPASRRKVVLATNVAETSLTIEGVRTVIDTGLARQASHDPARGVDRLQLARISRASAAQRAGRAGRTGPGRCLRLWDLRDERGMPEFETPEVARVDLASTVLALHAWGVADPRRFGWYEAPPEEAVAGAEALLVRLDALEGEPPRLTDTGRTLLAAPAHPRLSRLLLAAAGLGVAREGAALAALLSERDILLPPDRAPGGAPPAGPSERGDSDVLLRLDRLAEAESRRFAPSLRAIGIDPHAARRTASARDQFLRIARGAGADVESPADDETLLRLLLLAYPDRVVRRRPNDPAAGVMVGGRGVRLDASSTVREAPLFLALDPREDDRARKGELRVRLASAIRAEWLESLYPGAVARERVVRIDEPRGRVVGAVVERYGDLVLREAPHAAVDPDEGTALLAAWLGTRLPEAVRRDEDAAALLDRVDSLRAWRPDLDLPTLDADAMAAILREGAPGTLSLADLERLPWPSLLRHHLGRARAQLLDTLAPEAVPVPTGNRIRLTYEPGRPPVLAVRLQELFGLRETPRVAGGQVAVVLHLLGPNYQPVQVTSDLSSFWANTYAQVRKDLRARYPKHSWPDDPLAAKPEARGGRRPG
jgi:ATP-dependent helicase HrpB